MEKSLFIDRHKQLDKVEDCKWVIKIMKKIDTYLIKFKKDSTIKDNNYPLDYAIRGENCRANIVIIHDKYKFLVYNNI